MYNKLFTKILDSSIWLAPDPHRLVWITFLAAMDEDGNAMFASAANVAARARVTREQAEGAIAAFEAPDPDSGDPDNEGRRIERFPGGWHVLNAAKYRALVTKAIIREQTRVRVARHREKANAAVTHEKRKANAAVTPSVSRALAVSEAIPLPTVEVAGPALRAKPTTTPPAFNGTNAEALNGKAVTTLAADFSIPEPWGVDAESLGFKPGEVMREGEKFRQYWTAGRGAGTRRSVKGWRQTWSTWLEKAARDKR